jgi:hypothetical protein
MPTASISKQIFGRTEDGFVMFLTINPTCVSDELFVMPPFNSLLQIHISQRVAMRA